MKRKKGIIAECIDGEDSLVSLDRIAACGFESTFTGRYDIETVEKIANKCSRLGLGLEFIHAPFGGINNMWLPGDDFKGIYCGMIQSVDSAAATGIGAIVAHISSGWKAPEICDEGLKRYDALVEYAAKKNVVVAFENLRKVGNVAYFVDRYEDADNVKFCYDCGHEHCYTETVCFPDIFRSRMAFTHIHDNLGRDKNNPMGDPDMHVLPFDGNIDYARMMRKLDEYDYRGSLMLEVSSHPYPGVEPDAFVADAYSRIEKISKM